MIFSATMFFAKEIPVNIAERVARNFVYEQTGVKQNSIEFNVKTITQDGDPVYYVMNIKGGGFVIVSADDLVTPVLAYSFKYEFKTENQPENIKWWMSQYVTTIEHARMEQKTYGQAELWQKYNVDYTNFHASKATTDVTLETALWDQGTGYNDYCPPDDGPGNRAYTGCVATAMSIIMKYNNYPIQGSGSHTYYDYPHGTLSANFGETHYMWEQMPENGPSDAVAILMYHAGVSVEMNYGGNTEGGSGAYSWDVPDALSNYFRYASPSYNSKSDYGNTAWFNLLKNEIDNNRVAYYSGSGDDGGHAFVCDGYNTSNYLHFNFGWSGYNNGFYDVNSSSFEFNSNQTSITGIIPGDSNYEFDETDNPVASVTAVVDTNDLSQYKNIITWEAPAKGNLTGYNVYRDYTLIGENLPTSTLTTTDYPDEIDNYNYTVRAVYDAGVAEGVSDEAKGLFNVTFRITDESGGLVHQAQAIFVDDTVMSGFGTASFSNVPFGGPYHYTISKSGLPTTSGTVDFVYKDMTIYVVMDGTNANENIAANTVIIYPNPTAHIINIKGVDENSTIELYSTNGQKMLSTNADSDEIQLNISNFANGVYFLKIHTPKQNITHQIIIQK